MNNQEGKLIGKTGIVYLILFSVVLTCCDKSRDTSKTRHHYLVIADSRVYYETTGEGDAIIFLHGGLMDRRMWKKQVEEFANEHLTITVDLRGHGMTIDGDSSYYMYEAIRILMDSLHISKASVVGLSLGAIIATDLALEYPSHVSRLVLVTPGIHGWDKEVPADSLLMKNTSLMRKALVEAKDTALAAELFVRSWFDGPWRKPDEVDTAERNKAVMMATATGRNHKFKFWTRYAARPATGRLQEIRTPVLIIEGALDNHSIKMNCDTLMASIHGARRVMIHGVAHMPNMERPKEFNKLLGDFLLAE